jgi:hypothetical protein
MSGLAEARWVPVGPPLAPTACLGEGLTARKLLASMLAREEAQLSGLRATFSSALLLVLGPPDRLPWADGVQYFGSPSEGPTLLLPVGLRPELPVHLLSEALRARLPGAGPYLIAPGRTSVVDAGKASVVTREGLAKVQARWSQ